MAEFSYIARDTLGQKVTGTIAASSRREVVSALAGRALFPLEVRGAAQAVEGSGGRRVPASLMAALAR